MREPRSVLITGASSGIGAALAREYARPGAVLGLSGRDRERLATVSADCRERGARVVDACIDITDAAAVAAWAARIEEVAPIDLAIANAGIQGGLWRGGAGEALDEVHRVFATNVGGVYNTVYAVLPGMRERKAGQIALVGSLAGLRGLPFSPGYCASKAAVLAYGEALRGWLAAEGIRVAVILPGFVETRLSDTVSGPKPLMMSAQRAAGIIYRGLRRERDLIPLPYRMYLAARLLQAVPRRLADGVLRRIRVDIRPYD